MKKIALKIVLIMCIIFLSNIDYSVVNATSEDNVEHWAHDVIESFIEKSYILEEVTTFEPNGFIPKGDAAGIINRFFGYVEVKSGDTIDDMEIARENGYFQNSLPTDTITREEIAVVVCNLLSIAPIEEYESLFTDSEDISIWARGYVKALEKENIIVGYPDQMYRPQKNITNAEFITILDRCIGLGGNDLNFIDREITNIEIGILISEDDVIKVEPIEEFIEMNSGDKINFAVALPEDVEEFEYIIENDEIVEIDEEFCILTAIKSGETVVTLKNEKYETSFQVLIEK